MSSHCIGCHTGCDYAQCGATGTKSEDFVILALFNQVNPTEANNLFTKVDLIRMAALQLSDKTIQHETHKYTTLEPEKKEASCEKVPHCAVWQKVLW